MEVTKANASATRAVLELAQVSASLGYLRAKACGGEGKQEYHSTMHAYMREIIDAHTSWYTDGTKSSVMQRADQIADVASEISAKFHTVCAMLESLREAVRHEKRESFYDDITLELIAARAAAKRDLAFYMSKA